MPETNLRRECRKVNWRWLLLICVLISPVPADSVQLNPPEKTGFDTHVSPFSFGGCNIFGSPGSAPANDSSQLGSALLVGIVPSRQADLEQTVAGYKLSKIPLVAFDGERFVPAGFTDDPGLYYFVPAVGRILHQNLRNSITIFYLSILTVACAVGVIGFTLILSGWPSRIIGIGWLLIVASLVYRIGDVYLVEFALPTVLVPWCLWGVFAAARKSKLGFHALLFAAGTLIAVAEFIRLTSGVPALAFVVTLLAFSLPMNRTRKICGVAVLFSGFLLPLAYFDHLASQRDTFLASHSPSFQNGLSRHHFWHSAYMGLGFLRNGYVQGSCDDFNKEIVRSVDPTAVYLSPQYDDILRRETLTIATHHPVLTLFTVAAKLGIVAAVILVFANVGLWLVKRLRWPLQAALWAPVVLSSMPLLIVVPLKLYLVGVIAYSTMFGIVAALRLTHCVDVPPTEPQHRPAMA